MASEPFQPIRLTDREFDHLTARMARCKHLRTALADLLIEAAADGGHERTMAVSLLRGADNWLRDEESLTTRAMLSQLSAPPEYLV